MITARLARSLVASAVVLQIALVGAAGMAAQTQVTPDNGSLTVSQNLTGQTATFTVFTGLQTSQSRTLSVSCSGKVTSCTAPGSVTFVYSTNVNVTFSSLTAGSGTIILTASGGTSDQGSYNVTVTAPGTTGVAVTPDGQITPTHFSNTSGYSETFTVQNTGTGTNTYSFSCAGGGGVVCGTVPSPVTLNGNTLTYVSMPYSVGAAGTGTLTLTATGTGATDAGSFTIPVALTLSSVTGGSFTKDSRFLLVATANSYDSYGLITQLTDAGSKVTNYQYGGNVNNALLIKVTSVHDASGTVDLVTNIAYDNLGLVHSVQDPGGSFKYFNYDSHGRLKQVQNNAQAAVKAYGYTYSRTNSNGWTFQSSSPNAVVDSTFVQTSPVVATVSTQFVDGLGRPIQSVVQDGSNYQVAATQYDLMGRSWRTWKPYTRSAAGYDGSFNTNAIQWYNTSLGVTNAQPYGETLYRTDALGRVTRVNPEYLGTSPTIFKQTGYGIDATANQTITEGTDESGNKNRTYSDIFGNTVKSILGFGTSDAATTSFLYNVAGQRTQTTDPRGLITTYTLDTRGLVSTRVSPDAGTTNFKYDHSRSLRYTQDANQAAAGVVYFTNYDFAGRALNSGQGAATFSSLDPDAASLPSLETTTGNWLVVRAYDAKPATAGFPWSLFSTQITATTLTNVTGRQAAVASKSNGAWQVTLFSYDADGQVAARYTYTQANGGSSVLTAVNTTFTYTRDLRGSLTQRALTIGSSSLYQWYDYDGRGLLSRLSASTTATKPASPDVTDTYQPSGMPKSYQFLGGPVVPITYTIREQTAKIGDPATITYPFSASYTYNQNGSISVADFYSSGSSAPQKRYKYALTSYDALNRLKTADYSSWSGTAWTATVAYDVNGITYDVDGNIKTVQRYRQDATLIDNLTYTYPSNSNRLSSVSDAIATTTESWDAETGLFNYDANGNVVTAPAPYSITAATYDAANLPLSITRSGSTTNYRYDEVGERITKQVGTGNTEIYFREGVTTLGVFTVNSSGAIVSSYFNLVWDGRVVGRQPNTGSRDYYHFDMIGSTRAVTQGTTIVESHDYDPWGLELPFRGLGSGTKEAFGAKEQDAETGLDYFEARYYMAALGRWAAVDPAFEQMPEWSPYNYAYDDPVLNTDPDGRQAGPWMDMARSKAFVQALGAAEHGVANGAKRVGSAIAAPVLHPIRTAEGIATVYNAGKGDPVAASELANGVQTAIAQRVDRWQNGGIEGKMDVATETFGTLATIFVGGELADAAELTSAASVTRMAPDAVELAPRASGVVEDGIYEFQATNGKTYVGQSGRISERLAEHVRDGKLSAENVGNVKRTAVNGGKVAREIAEQRRIDRLGGIKSGDLANKRNPIGPARRHLMQ